MKKILIVINTIYIGGGAERAAVSIGNQLYNNGYDVNFLTFKDKKEKYEYKGKYTSLKNKDIKNRLGALWAIFKRAKKIKQYCKNNNIDTVISFMEEANFASIISRIIFKNKVGIIVSLRNNPERKNKVAKLLIKLLYRKADKVIVNSKSIEKKLNEKFNIKNTTTIYNPIDFKEIDKLKKEKIDEKYLKLFKNSFVFITIGRLTVQKNQKLLIQEFAKVNKKIQNTKLLIIGEGELKNNLKNQIKELNLENNIFLLGRQINVFPFLIKSDCFVFSSLWEGMPNTVLEAAYCNLPVISTDCETGPREILAPKLNISENIRYPYIGDFGVLVKNNFYEEMMRAIEVKGKNNNNLDMFSLNLIIKKWEKILKKY